MEQFTFGLTERAPFSTKMESFSISDDSPMTELSVDPIPRGAKLSTVEYEWLDVDQELQTSEKFDYASIAVVFTFESGVKYRLTWRYERLTSAGCVDRDPDAYQTIDASGRWARFIGARVEAQSVGWGGSEWGRQIWCTRLDFDMGGALSVALGELNQDGCPIYIPDALLVTDNEVAALSYRPSASDSSAWLETRGGSALANSVREVAV